MKTSGQSLLAIKTLSGSKSQENTTINFTKNLSFESKNRSSTTCMNKPEISIRTAVNILPLEKNPGVILHLYPISHIATSTAMFDDKQWKSA